MLAEADYSGWLVVEAEQDPAKAHPLTYATMGFKNLSRMARDAGFTILRMIAGGRAACQGTSAGMGRNDTKEQLDCRP